MKKKISYYYGYIKHESMLTPCQILRYYHQSFVKLQNNKSNHTGNV